MLLTQTPVDAQRNVRLPHKAKSGTGPRKAKNKPLGSKKVKFKAVRGVRSMRVLVAFGCAFLSYFLWWFVQAGPIGYAPFFWLMSIALGFKLLRMGHEWYHYVNVKVPEAPSPQGIPQALRVDVLTTACPGEPYAMIVGTLRAMQAIRYPHTSYLCDEGNDPYLRAECTRLGVVHVTRQLKVDAKAGNINNALRQATGDLCVVLDPDHVPTPDFLDRVLPYFNDPAVGYVQVVQAYGNQHESLVARGAAEQTYHFYGPLMMGMNGYNTVQAIGANCTFRRAALESIGGHAAGLTEDMHTAMRLHAAGWRSVYVPEVLSRGLVPASLSGFYAQQLKWSRGAFELLFCVYPRLFKYFTWRQRLHYLTLPLYFISGVVSLIDFGVPLLALIFDKAPLHVSMGQFMIHLGPLVGFSLLIRLCAQRWLREPHEAGLHLAGGLLRFSTWWVYTLGLVYALINKRVPYLPTPKESELRNEWLICLPNLGVALISAIAGGYVIGQYTDKYTRFTAFLSLFNAVILLAAVVMAQHELLRTLRRTLREWAPVRQGLLSGVHLTEIVRRVTVKWVRHNAVYAACSLLLITVLANDAYWKYQPALSGAVQWERYAGAGPHLGVVVWPRALSARLVAAEKTVDPAPSIVALNLAGGPLPYLRDGERQMLNKQRALPMMSWPVTPSQISGVTQNTLKAERHGLSARSLLMRPLLKAVNATAYRGAWRRMVKNMQAAGYEKDGWVWSPPCADSVAAYFPGSGYVQWVAVDCTQPQALANPAAFYESFRRQQAGIMELHNKPVLLILPRVSATPTMADVTKWTRRYPEVRAVIFDANKPALFYSVTAVVEARQNSAVAPLYSAGIDLVNK